MRWQRLPGSRNVEDRRGRGMAVGGGLGCGGILLILVISLLTGADPMALFDMLGGPQATLAPGPSAPADVGGSPDDELGQFASAVLGSLEQTWRQLMPRIGQPYRDARLVLYDARTPTRCGMGQAAMGPFYCPADETIYLDLDFFQTMSRRLGASGDFAQAYVIAHEFGHHIQKALGVSDQVHRLQQQSSQTQANQLSVRLELQADCLAGVWGAYANQQGVLEPGDIEEGLRAASAIGDDTLQRNSRGAVSPESFTHGSSEQRMRWLHTGLERGDPELCETFDGGRL